MKLKLSFLALTLAIASSSVIAADPKPIAKVNGVAIPASYAEVMLNVQVAQGAKNDENLRGAVKEELIRRELLIQQAKKRGLDKKSEIVVRMDIARQDILIGNYINEWAESNQISDDKLRAEYDRRVAAMADSSEYKARHIQTLTEAEAQSVISKLQSGAKFADLAKDSIDLGSKDKGGDIDWVSPQGLPPAFAQALSKLEKGKFTTVPVATQYGFHVILVEETRKATPPTFESKKNELRQLLEQQALNAHIKDLLSKTKVE
jgi:peptidyl-prolyl cis-trans isomerase C